MLPYKKGDNLNIVKLLVDDQKLSKYAIAKACQVSWNTVSLWYKGVYAPKHESHVILEKLYGKKRTKGSE